MKTATVTKTVFHLEYGKYRDEYTVTFHNDGLTQVRDDVRELVFVQYYYNDATKEAAIDILEIALLTKESADTKRKSRWP